MTTNQVLGSIPKAVDNFVAEHGAPAFMEVFSKASSFEKWRKAYPRPPEREIGCGTKGSPKAKKKDRTLDVIRGLAPRFDKEGSASASTGKEELSIRDKVARQKKANKYAICLDSSQPVPKILARIERSLAALRGSNRIFVVDGIGLVRILDGRIAPLTIDSLHYELNTRLAFYKWTENGGSYTRTPCSKQIAISFLSQGSWLELSRLERISPIPLVRIDGTVCAKSGYSSQDQAILAFRDGDFSIKENPTREDAERALGVLIDLLREFSFESNVDLSATISLLLTAVSRQSYGLAPIHIVTANQPGTGKGTLSGIASILATGTRDSFLTGYPDDENEVRKKIFAVLALKRLVLSFDNVRGILGGETLEMTLTSPTLIDRRLGTSETIACSTRILTMANGNNIRTSIDMIRRSVLIRLRANVERPEARTFSRNIEDFALANHKLLVTACLTIIPAYLLSRDSIESHAPLGSFGDWDRFVRQPIIWLGLPDPVLSQQEIREQDDGSAELSGLLEAWASELGDKLPMTAPELIVYAQGHEGAFKTALLGVCCDRQGYPQTRLLAYYLRKNNGVICNGLALEKGSRRGSGFQWSVALADELPSVDPSTLASTLASTLPSALAETPTDRGSQDFSVDGVDEVEFPLIYAGGAGTLQDVNGNHTPPFSSCVNSKTSTPSTLESQNPLSEGISGSVDASVDASVDVDLHSESPEDPLTEPQKHTVEYNGVIVDVEDCDDF